PANKVCIRWEGRSAAESNPPFAQLHPAAVIRIYDETGNVIETHEHAGAVDKSGNRRNKLSSSANLNVERLDFPHYSNKVVTFSVVAEHSVTRQIGPTAANSAATKELETCVLHSERLSAPLWRRS